MSDLVSRPFNPGADKCCDACVFGAVHNAHADWCDQPARNLQAQDRRMRGIQAMDRLRVSNIAWLLGACTFPLPVPERYASRQDNETRHEAE